MYLQMHVCVVLFFALSHMTDAYANDDRQKALEKMQIEDALEAQELEDTQEIERLGMIKKEIEMINIQLSTNSPLESRDKLIARKSELERENSKLTVKQIRKQFIAHDMNDIPMQSDFIGKKIFKPG